MSRKYWIIPLCLAIVASCAVKKDTHSKDAMLQEMDRWYVQVQPDLFACKMEVTNREYSQFLAYLRVTDTAFWRINLLDTTRWNEKLFYGEPYVKFYHIHPAYASYPVVNVSWKSATAYCEWLTEMYRQQPVKKYPGGHFRLPMREEWRAAARGTDKDAVFPWKGGSLVRSNGQIPANFTMLDQGTVLGETSYTARSIDVNAQSGGFITSEVRSYWPNSIGLYNMAGNVSEWVQENTGTIGGNWRSGGYHLLIDAEEEFDNSGDPSPAIGFRVFFDTGEGAQR